MERFSLDSVDRAFLDLEIWPPLNEEVLHDPILRDTIERRSVILRSPPDVTSNLHGRFAGGLCVSHPEEI